MEVTSRIFSFDDLFFDIENFNANFIDNPVPDIGNVESEDVNTNLQNENVAYRTLTTPPTQSIVESDFDLYNDHFTCQAFETPFSNLFEDEDLVTNVQNELFTCQTDFPQPINLVESEGVKTDVQNKHFSYPTFCVTPPHINVESGSVNTDTQNQHFSCQAFVPTLPVNVENEVLPTVVDNKIITSQTNSLPPLSVNVIERKDLDSDAQKKIFTCHVCDKQFSSRRYLSLHCASHLTTETSACVICGETFANAEDLSEHTVQHEEIEIHHKEPTCFTAKKSLSNQTNLVHKQSNQLPIPDSKLSQVDDNQLTSENQLLHQHTGLYLQCDFCDKRFSNKSNLYRHIRIHRNSKKFICSICQEKFSQKSALQHHYLSHANIKLFPCNTCNKAFAKKSALTVHLLNHEGKKPFVCLVCDRRFASKRDFKRHGLDHMPGEHSVCDICGKEFPTKQKLNLHFKRHTNERPFQCDKCGRGFTYGSHLKRHKLLHTGEKPFVCEFCGEAFYYKSLLTKHRLEMHDFDADDLDVYLV